MCVRHTTCLSRSDECVGVFGCGQLNLFCDIKTFPFCPWTDTRTDSCDTDARCLGAKGVAARVDVYVYVSTVGVRAVVSCFAQCVGVKERVKER